MKTRELLIREIRGIAQTLVITSTTIWKGKKKTVGIQVKENNRSWYRIL